MEEAIRGHKEHQYDKAVNRSEKGDVMCEVRERERMFSGRVDGRGGCQRNIDLAKV